MTEQPVEAALTIQIHGRKSGKTRPAWDLIEAIRAEHGATLDAFARDLALYGMVAMDEHGRRIDPGAWVIRP